MIRTCLFTLLSILLLAPMVGCGRTDRLVLMADESKNATEAPKTTADESKNATEAPKTTADESKNAAEVPKTTADESKNATEVPKTTADESKNAAEAPKTTADEPSISTEISSGGDADESAMILVKNPLYQKNEPLLFDSGYYEDNSSCKVCHIDFEHELIAEKHEEGGITCAACHGDSITHSGDEFNITRPDVIWGRSEIGEFCKQCHPKHKKPDAVKAFLTKWHGKRRENGRFVMSDSACTDCHGKHAIVSDEGDFK